MREKRMHQQRPSATKMNYILKTHPHKKKKSYKSKTKNIYWQEMPEEQTGSSSNESDTDNSTVLWNGEDFYHSYMNMIFLIFFDTYYEQTYCRAC